MKKSTTPRSSSIAVNPVLQRVFIVAVFSVFLLQVVEVALSLNSADTDAGRYLGLIMSVVGIPAAFFITAYAVIPKTKGMEAAIFGATLLTVVGIAIFALVSQLIVYLYVIPGSHGLHIGSYEWTVFGAAFGLYAAILYCLRRCNSL